jgi:hypothetical protein
LREGDTAKLGLTEEDVPPDERGDVEEAEDKGSLMTADGGGRHGWR